MPSRHKDWGRRRRRLRRTLGVLIVLGLAAGAGGVWWYRASRPATYQPGEVNPDITRQLARNLSTDAPVPRFTDVTAASGLDTFRHFTGPRTSQLPEDMGSGVAWGDYDRDGDDDIFLVAAGGALTASVAERAPSRLYENLGDGTFRPVEAFAPLRIVGMAAAWGDVDDDGWPDLVVTSYGGLHLFHNVRGELVPAEEFPSPEGFWAGATWGDYDNDRDLDLYVCGYVRYTEDPEAATRLSQQYGKAVAYTLNPLSFAPERNLLFRNDGGRFEEVGAELGVDNPEGRSLSALWHDFDDDGWLDLYVANDISDNVLYLNRGGTFADVGTAAWVADYRGAMGLAVGDWNRDGDDDLFISHWIGQENALYDSLLADLGSGGELHFQDRSAPLGVGQTALRFVGWGTEFADFDADGWLDLVVANGSTFETEDRPPRLKPQESLLFWNRHGEYFDDLAPAIDALATPRVSRGLAVADYDRDGDVDLLFVHHGEGVQLLRNDMQTGHWLELLPRRRLGEGIWGDAPGTKVIVHTGELALRRSVGGASYLSQSSSTLHFGLGEATRVDRVEVRWSGGETEEFSNLEADAAWELREGEGEPRRLEGGGAEVLDERQRVHRFWEKYRAATRAMKIEGDLPRAIALFREALALDPGHEDARYYLGNSLAAEGETEEAMSHFEELMRSNPQSRRAYVQWGMLRAETARTAADLEAAEETLEKALAINPEETGTLLGLGEIALLRGDPALAEQRLEWACRTNPKAVGGFFLRGYVAWKRGDAGAAGTLLDQALAARGPEWKPEGTAAEGDVVRRMHREDSPLARYWRAWDGNPDPASAFVDLDSALSE